MLPFTAERSLFPVQHVTEHGAGSPRHSIDLSGSLLPSDTTASAHATEKLIETLFHGAFSIRQKFFTQSFNFQTDELTRILRVQMGKCVGPKDQLNRQ
jgi:hypothetical protein